MARFFFFVLIIFFCSACERTDNVYEPLHAPFMQVDPVWADSILQGMTLEQKIGQLILLKTDSKSTIEKDSLYHWVENGLLGGLLMNDLKLNEFINRLDTCKKRSPVPLFVATDQQVLLNNQFSDQLKFPKPVSLSAVGQDSVRSELDELMIQQCKALGINFCFSPGLDRFENDSLTFDSNIYEFEWEKNLINSANKMRTLQDSKILAVAGAFEDYLFMDGDTTGMLDSILNPYFNLCQNGLSGIMVDQKIFDNDTINELPTYFIKNYFRQKLEFGGLIVSEKTQSANLDKLLHAGTEIFVVRDSVRETIDYIKAYVEEGLLPMKSLDSKVYRVLLAKEWMSLDSIQTKVVPEYAKAWLQNDELELYARRLFESSIVLANNPNALIPFSKNYNRDFRVFNYGAKALSNFNSFFKNYTDFKSYQLAASDSVLLKELDFKANKKSNIVLTLEDLNLNAKKDSLFIASVNRLSNETDVCLVNFGNPYNLQYFDTTLTSIQAFERNEITEAYAAQLLFGGVSSTGSLPMAVATHLPYKHLNSTEVIRLRYGAPEEVGIAAYKLVGLDAIAKSAIASGATPGCQILVAKNGSIIYSKAFGQHGDKIKQKVLKTDLYDVASITKVAATTLASMKLYERGKFKTSDKLSKHLELGDNSKMKRITVKQIMTHASSLQPHMPISKYIMYRDSTDSICNDYFCKIPQGDYSIKIADSMYMHRKWRDTIWQEVVEIQPAKRKKKYRYSDVNFNLMQRLVENKSEEKFDAYLYRSFYKPLGLRNTTFNPREKFAKEKITPTQNDEKWRKQTLRGYVHDESAALLGGVAGNAGLFSNAEDLAVIFQMLLNGGSYGGQEYFKPATVNYFTSAKHGNHRGLGFDRKYGKKTASISNKASKNTYGHTGFTGPCVWVDPDEELVFIFIANRINPSVKNKTLFRKSIRKRLHTVVYDSLNSYKKSGIDEIDPPKVIEAKLTFNDEVN